MSHQPPGPVQRAFPCGSSKAGAWLLSSIPGLVCLVLALNLGSGTAGAPKKDPVEPKEDKTPLEKPLEKPVSPDLSKGRLVDLDKFGNPLVGVSRIKNKRVIVDCGFTRYYFDPGNPDGGSSFVTRTAGTVRFGENVAAYLAGKESR